MTLFFEALMTKGTSSVMKKLNCGTFMAVNEKKKREVGMKEKVNVTETSIFSHNEKFKYIFIE